MSICLLNENDLNAYCRYLVTRGTNTETRDDKDLSFQVKFQTVAEARKNREQLIQSILTQWMKHRMRVSLKTFENAAFFKPVLGRLEGPLWVKIALRQGLSVFEFDAREMPPKLKEQMCLVTDFLRCVADQYVSRRIDLAEKTESCVRIRLDYLKTNNQYETFDQVLSAAQKYYKTLVLKQQQRNQDHLLCQKALSGTQKVMSLSGGMCIVRLTTPAALDFEARHMRHCVRDYDPFLNSGKLQIYSLRDRHNLPHVTFAVYENDLTQCRGKGDAAPALKYIPFVQEFIRCRQFRILESPGRTGLIYQNHQYYDFFHLPPGFVIQGDVDLSFNGLSELPDLSHVQVLGCFNCSGNRLSHLMGAPQHVKGHFYCAWNRLTCLKGAPRQVGGNFNCAGNRLTDLREGPLQVGGHFNCAENNLTSLKGAPKYLNGSFECAGNPLTDFKQMPLSAHKDVSENLAPCNPLCVYSAAQMKTEMKRIQSCLDAVLRQRQYS